MAKSYFLLCLLLIFGIALPAKAQVGDSLVINFKDGHKVALALTDIRKITFDSLTSGVTENKPQNDLQVSPSYPNPSRNEATIDFSISTAGVVKISIFDAKGKSVRNLQVNAEAGKNQINWDGLDNLGNHVLSGSYLYEVRFQDDRQVRKMVVIK